MQSECLLQRRSLRLKEYSASFQLANKAHSDLFVCLFRLKSQYAIGPTYWPTFKCLLPFPPTPRTFLLLSFTDHGASAADSHYLQSGRFSSDFVKVQVLISHTEKRA